MHVFHVVRCCLDATSTQKLSGSDSLFVSLCTKLLLSTVNFHSETQTSANILIYQFNQEYYSYKPSISKQFMGCWWLLSKLGLFGNYGSNTGPWLTVLDQDQQPWRVLCLKVGEWLWNWNNFGQISAVMKVNHLSNDWGSSSSNKCMYNSLVLNLEHTSCVMWLVLLSVHYCYDHNRSAKCVYLKRGATYENGGHNKAQE